MINEIIICPQCSGWGTKEIPDRQGTYDKITCSKCCGEGRLIKETTVIYKPYDQ